MLAFYSLCKKIPSSTKRSNQGDVAFTAIIDEKQMHHVSKLQETNHYLLCGAYMRNIDGRQKQPATDLAQSMQMAMFGQETRRTESLSILTLDTNLNLHRSPHRAKLDLIPWYQCICARVSPLLLPQRYASALRNKEPGNEPGTLESLQLRSNSS